RLVLGDRGDPEEPPLPYRDRGAVAFEQVVEVPALEDDQLPVGVGGELDAVPDEGVTEVGEDRVLLAVGVDPPTAAPRVVHVPRGVGSAVEERVGGERYGHRPRDPATGCSRCGRCPWRPRRCRTCRCSSTRG